MLLLNILNNMIVLGKGVRIAGNTKLVGSIELGDYTYINENSTLSAGEKTKIQIGKFCSIAANCNIISYNSHNYKQLSTWAAFKRFKKNIDYGSKKIGVDIGKTVIIGNDVWIGTNVIILPGVKIGDGAVVGAGSIVTRDIPPYAIAVGNPAKVVKYRFSKEEITKIKNLNWRNRSIEKIIDNYNLDFLR